MQEVDAQRRLAILRGEVPAALPEPAKEEEEATSQAASRGKEAEERLSYPGASRKKRKRAGEDDTEFELRLANERLEPADTALEKTRKPTSQAPITDRAGHIDLFGEDGSGTRTEKNQEAEREKEKKKREYEDQYTMRFSNAAGRRGLENPWYREGNAAPARPMKDVWGNDDPKRKERDAQRMISNDPLAMMKQGASKTRELKKERKRVEDERHEELKQLRKEQRRNDRHDRRREDERRHRDRSPKAEKTQRRGSRERYVEESPRDSGRRRRHRERDDEDRRRRHRSRSPERRRHHHSRAT